MLHFVDSIELFTAAYPVGSGDGTNRYGDPVRVEADGVTVPAQVTRQGRGMAKEELTNMDRRIEFYRVLCAPEVPVDGLSRVEWMGRSFEVYGEPEPFNDRNGHHHQEFVMRGVQGGASSG